MIRELLHKLLEKKYNKEIDKKLTDLIINYNEEQLGYLLVNGIKLTENINLYCYIGTGFRCYNTNENLVGKLHICNVVEKFLNNKLSEKLNS